MWSFLCRYQWNSFFPEKLFWCTTIPQTNFLPTFIITAATIVWKSVRFFFCAMVRWCTVGWQHDIPRQKYTPVYMSNDNDWHLKFYLCWSRLYRVLPPSWPIQGHFSAFKDGLLSISDRHFRSEKFCKIITPCKVFEPTTINQVARPPNFVWHISRQSLSPM